jgi:hypothetical protein
VREAGGGVAFIDAWRNASAIAAPLDAGRKRLRFEAIDVKPDNSALQTPSHAKPVSAPLRRR